MSATAAPALVVRGLSHRYRRADRAALDEVSFEVEAGEIFGVLGPNGGGKTTLFRILATLLRPRAQRNGRPTLEVFGRDVLRDPAGVRATLGVVFQQPSLDGKLTARENLRHHGRLYGLCGGELEQAIDASLARFDLGERGGERVERFSGGMRRRVELAKAMLTRPHVLLMDEPATGLDPAARRALWAQLETLRAEAGVTLVLTTHLMDEAARCDRLAIIAEGRLVTVDAPAALTARIGGDVVTLELRAAAGDADAANVADVAGAIGERFGPWAPGGEPRVIEGGVIRCEREDGAKLVAEIGAAFGGRIARMSVGQPTLEDVFVHLTGRGFEGERVF
ncbi:MAG: ATP-binding cassette domain-containing protein [Phycisphaeraceae bacterium]